MSQEVVDAAGAEPVTFTEIGPVELKGIPGTLELVGAGWPWRPTALLALTATAALGVALVPAAATRRRRR